MNIKFFAVAIGVLISGQSLPGHAQYYPPAGGGDAYPGDGAEASYPPQRRSPPRDGGYSPGQTPYENPTGRSSPPYGGPGTGSSYGVPDLGEVMRDTQRRAQDRAARSPARARSSYEEDLPPGRAIGSRQAARPGQGNATRSTPAAAAKRSTTAPSATDTGKRPRDLSDAAWQDILRVADQRDYITQDECFSDKETSQQFHKTVRWTGYCSKRRDESDFRRLMAHPVRQDLDRMEFVNEKDCLFKVERETSKHQQGFGTAASRYCESRGYS